MHTHPPKLQTQAARLLSFRANIQNRQRIRSFSPFNSVRVAFLKSRRQVACAFCFRWGPDSFHPNLHFSFHAVSATFLRFASQPLLIITSQQKCFTKFTGELKQNQTTTQSTK